MKEKPERIERRDEKGLRPRQIPLFVLLWAVSSLLTVLCGIVLRSAASSVAAVIANAVPIEWQIENQWYLRWTVRAVDPCSVAILTILGFVSIIGFDFLYRDGFWKGTIRKKFITVTAIQAAILALGWLAIAISARFA
jgi:hypothetical protein